MLQPQACKHASACQGRGECRVHNLHRVSALRQLAETAQLRLHAGYDLC